MTTDPAPAARGARTARANSSAPAAVLDTNVVLDWLVFREVSVAPVAAAIESGHLVWLACAHMREEFERVLRYPALQRWSIDAATALAQFDLHARRVPDPGPGPSSPPRPGARLVCTDPDDQVFLDLSHAYDAHWLLTRDRALLQLARRAWPLGLAIVTPAAWPGLSGTASSP